MTADEKQALREIVGAVAVVVMVVAMWVAL